MHDTWGTRTHNPAHPPLHSPIHALGIRRVELHDKGGTAAVPQRVRRTVVVKLRDGGGYPLPCVRVSCRQYGDAVADDFSPEGLHTLQATMAPSFCSTLGPVAVTGIRDTNARRHERQRRRRRRSPLSHKDTARNNHAKCQARHVNLFANQYTQTQDDSCAHTHARNRRPQNAKAAKQPVLWAIPEVRPPVHQRHAHDEAGR